MHKRLPRRAPRGSCHQPYRLDIRPLREDGADALLAAPQGAANGANTMSAPFAPDDILFRANHPDEAVQIDLLKRGTGMMLGGEDDLGGVARHAIAAHAEKEARKEGKLWTPLLDAVACEIARTETARVSPVADGVLRWAVRARTASQLWPLLDFRYPPIRMAAMRRLLVVDPPGAKERLSREPSLLDAFITEQRLPVNACWRLAEWAIDRIARAESAPPLRRRPDSELPWHAIRSLRTMANVRSLPSFVPLALADLWRGRAPTHRPDKLRPGRRPSRFASAWAHIALVELLPWCPARRRARALLQWYQPGPRFPWLSVDLENANPSASMLRRIARQLRRDDSTGWLDLQRNGSARRDLVVRREIFGRATKDCLGSSRLMPRNSGEWSLLFTNLSKQRGGWAALFSILDQAPSVELAKIGERSWRSILPRRLGPQKSTTLRLMAVSLIPGARQRAEVRSVLIARRDPDILFSLCLTAEVDELPPPLAELADLAPDWALQALDRAPALEGRLTRPQLTRLLESGYEPLRHRAMHIATHTPRL